MRPKDRSRGKRIDGQLQAFSLKIMPLKGIEDAKRRAVLIEQIVESLRRIEYVEFLRNEDFDPQRADPHSGLFDPLRASIFHLRRGNIDEAYWLIFLATHFGKHVRNGWGFVRDVYGAMGHEPWTWARVSSDIQAFRRWLAANEIALRQRNAFSNHRKYQSLSAWSNVGTGAVVASYVNWIGPPRTHQEMIREIHRQVGQNPKEVFAFVYKSMNAVTGFGRLGKFDYLTMLGKLDVAPIDPDRAYLSGATGPLSGARLLFANNATAKLSARDVDERLISLDGHLNVGMQVLEDSLCNWQKSPDKFISFRG